MIKKYALIVLMSFLAGILTTFLVASNFQEDIPTGYTVVTTRQNSKNSNLITRTLGDGPNLGSLFDFGNEEKASPQDWIPEDKIHVYKDKVIIDIDDPQWSTFTDTNSMDPVIDQGANAIQVVPKSPSQIDVGDIISYTSKYTTGTIIHRVVEIGEDKDGWYAVMKGDNNSQKDPGKVRFDQILRVVVGIIY
ncbi:hypothetical protein HOD20_03910 [archaeon]|jgi:hypothetical protein|nr:hypothetical protein [archaeon]MBT4648052.1 hypothetical protein [archaeon]MBT6822694.1 hypothetical protein [archaeon]MBT7392437.1 hypothetical protein [archaeon]